MRTNNESTSRKPLRLWPGVLGAALIVVGRYIVEPFIPGGGWAGLLAGFAGAVVILIWWLFLSRAPWGERIGAIVLMVAATYATRFVVHPSIAGGMMGQMVPLLAVPATLGPVFVVWAVATRRLADRVRRATMVVAILLGCAVWTLVRTDGVKGDTIAQLRWRWTPTAEERLLARGGEDINPIPRPAATESPKEAPAAKGPDKPAEAPGMEAGSKAPAKSEPPLEKAEPPAATEPASRRGEATATSEPDRRVEGLAMSEPSGRRVEWPGFRGSRRDGVIPGLRIETDWAKSPPVELWRKPIGPGWSSFAVDGDFAYTQEQRGDHELVSCYRVSTGEPVWRHRDAVRFYESNGGPGPRATPTLHRDRLYTLGATGIVNALDASTGAVVWSRNAKDDTGAPLPGWGFAGSPLVVGDLVIVAASGRLVAYDLASGQPRWTRTTGGGGYSSPHLVTIDGVAQVLLQNGGGVTSVAPADGSVLWSQKGADAVAIVQPNVVAGDDVLIASGDAMGGLGIRRLALSREGGAWTVQERWSTRGLKPYYNDYVVHKGHAFGFDGTILSSISLEDGERKWKGGRYGAGQMVLLPDQDMLLVLSEDGELVLVAATPEKHTEIARFKAIEGKTWNHPVVVGDVLLVRNGEEMAAFRLPIAGRSQGTEEF